MTALDDHLAAIKAHVDVGSLTPSEGLALMEEAVQTEVSYFNTLKLMRCVVDVEDTP